MNANIKWNRQGNPVARHLNRRFRRPRTQIPSLRSAPITRKDSSIVTTGGDIVTAGGGDVTVEELEAIKRLEDHQPKKKSNNDNNNDNVSHIYNRK